MSSEELNEFQQVLKTILEKQRSPWITPLTPFEKEVYRQVQPTLYEAVQRMFKEECKKYEERKMKEDEKKLCSMVEAFQDVSYNEVIKQLLSPQGVPLEEFIRELTRAEAYAALHRHVNGSKATGMRAKIKLLSSGDPAFIMSYRAWNSLIDGEYEGE